MNEQEVIVYRVQDGDGRGPWKPRFSHRWCEPRADHDNLPPWFIEFGSAHERGLTGEHIGSGCRTIGQLQRWITESEYQTLHEFGYRAVRMRVNRILAESPIQCLFARSKPLCDEVEEIELYARAAAAVVKGGG